MPDSPQHVPVIAIASGNGGVGKTAVAVNLALALTAQGQRTGLVDADLYGPDVPRMMGLRRRAEAGSQTSGARLDQVTGPKRMSCDAPGAQNSSMRSASCAT
jgi:Mrp family chromosome partitioning ATPase